MCYRHCQEAQQARLADLHHSFIHSATFIECLLCARHSNESVTDFALGTGAGWRWGSGPADKQ